MIRVLEFFGKDVTKHPEVLAKCFADTTADVVKDAEVIGLPTGCFLGAGSEVTTANGTKARLKSDGNWVWLAKADLITRTITENGTYEAADDNADGYVEVTVNVPEPTLVEKSITANGEYDPADDEADGYSSVTVNVPAPTYNITGTIIVDEYSGRATDFSFDVITPDGMTTTGDDDLACIKTYINSFVGSSDLIEISASAFSYSNITHADLSSSSVTTIQQEAFNDCSNLEEIILPNTIETIGSEAFKDCGSLESFTCMATNPPTIESDTFYGINGSCIFYVPAASVDTYKAATNWSDLAENIQAIPTT